MALGPGGSSRTVDHLIGQIKATLQCYNLHGRTTPGHSRLHRRLPRQPQGFGEVRIDWDRRVIPLTGKEAATGLYNGEPRLMYYDDDQGGVLQTRSMKDGDEIVATRCLRKFFRSHSRG